MFRSLAAALALSAVVAAPAWSQDSVAPRTGAPVHLIKRDGNMTFFMTPVSGGRQPVIWLWVFMDQPVMVDTRQANEAAMQTTLDCDGRTSMATHIEGALDGEVLFSNPASDTQAITPDSPAEAALAVLCEGGTAEEIFPDLAAARIRAQALRSGA